MELRESAGSGRAARIHGDEYRAKHTLVHEYTSAFMKHCQQTIPNGQTRATTYASECISDCMRFCFGIATSRTNQRDRYVVREWGACSALPRPKRDGPGDAATKAEMDRKAAAEARAGRRRWWAPRHWRTREDPFAEN